MALNHYLIGNSVVMIGSCSVVDPLTRAETPTDPTTVTFTRVKPDGSVTTYTTGSPEFSHLAVGIDAVVVGVDQAGVEKWRYESTGTCEAAAEDLFQVNPSSVI